MLRYISVIRNLVEVVEGDEWLIRRYSDSIPCSDWLVCVTWCEYCVMIGLISDSILRRQYLAMYQSYKRYSRLVNVRSQCNHNLKYPGIQSNILYHQPVKTPYAHHVTQTNHSGHSIHTTWLEHTRCASQKNHRPRSVPKYLPTYAHNKLCHTWKSRYFLQTHVDLFLQYHLNFLICYSTPSSAECSALHSK